MFEPPGSSVPRSGELRVSAVAAALLCFAQDLWACGNETWGKN